MTDRRRLLALLAGVAGLAPAAASARDRTRAWSATGSGGRSASGGMTRSTNRDTGAWSRQAAQTGPGGRTRSATGSGTVQDGTYTGTRSVTSPAGNTRTRDIEASRNP